MEKKSMVIILKQFFGYKPGQNGLKDFNEELKMLSPAEKMELAQLAAKELGCLVADPILPAQSAAA